MLPNLESPLRGNAVKTEPEMLAHYYGDLVRRLFVAAGVVMVVASPFVASLLPLPVLSTAFGVFALVVIAGLTNPSKHWSAVLNLVTAAVGLIVFQSRAVVEYLAEGSSGPRLLLFAVNQVLALLFLASLYYSSKTFRGKFID